MLVKSLPHSNSQVNNYQVNNITISVGTQAKSASDLHDEFNQILTSSNNQKESISGVNSDEELTNMLAYQRSYEAAARVVTTVDDMMDKIINHMGQVGIV